MKSAIVTPNGPMPLTSVYHITHAVYVLSGTANYDIASDHKSQPKFLAFSKGNWS